MRAGLHAARIAAAKSGTTGASSMSQLRLAGLFLCAAFLNGCATVNSDQRAYLDAQSAKLSQQRASVVADSCVLRDELGDSDYVLKRASIQVGKAVASSAKSYLVKSGLPVGKVVVPFICGVAVSDQVQTLVAEDKGSPPAAGVAMPIPLLESVKSNAALADAYQKLIQRVVQSEPVGATGQVNRRQSGADIPRGLDLPAEQVAALKRQLGEQVWVVRAGGVQVSAGKSIGVGLLTAVLTAGLTGGAAIAYSAPVDGNGYDVALVDLRAGEITWKKRVPVQNGDPGDPALYNQKWAQAMFDPFVKAAR